MEVVYLEMQYQSISIAKSALSAGNGKPNETALFAGDTQHLDGPEVGLSVVAAVKSGL
jgi:hypothetical protein